MGTYDRAMRLLVLVLAGCGAAEVEPGEAREPPRAPSGEAGVTGTATAGAVASSHGSAKDDPNRPAFEASARVRDDAPADSASAEPPDPMASCEPKAPPAGWENCEAVEVTGEGPCELECWRERKVTTKTACCESPVRGAIFGKSGVLVETDACAYVDPSCAHSSEKIQSAESGFHLQADADPRELVLVQGGCEMRAMSHGYVPSGVAAWTGCAVAKRFRWNGSRFTLVR